MEFKINIPDELVESFKTVTDTLNAALKEATNTAKDIKKDIEEGVDSFDREAFDKATDELYTDIKASIKEIDSNVEERLQEGAKTLDDIFEMMFSQADLHHVKVNKNHMLNRLYKDVAALDRGAADWIKQSANSGKFGEDTEAALAADSTHEALHLLFDWNETPQGSFLWKSIYKNLKTKNKGD